MKGKNQFENNFNLRRNTVMVPNLCSHDFVQTKVSVSPDKKKKPPVAEGKKKEQLA
jgi:hypothetical protein